MGDISLTSGMRSNLLSLQSTVKLLTGHRKDWPRAKRLTQLWTIRRTFSPRSHILHAQ
jgi:hypothetical protein